MHIIKRVIFSVSTVFLIFLFVPYAVAGGPIASVSSESFITHVLSSSVKNIEILYIDIFSPFGGALEEEMGLHNLTIKCTRSDAVLSASLFYYNQYEAPLVTVPFSKSPRTMTARFIQPRINLGDKNPKLSVQINFNPDMADQPVAVTCGISQLKLRDNSGATLYHRYGLEFLSVDTSYIDFYRGTWEDSPPKKPFMKYNSFSGLFGPNQRYLGNGVFKGNVHKNPLPEKTLGRAKFLFTMEDAKRYFKNTKGVSINAQGEAVFALHIPEEIGEEMLLQEKVNLDLYNLTTHVGKTISHEFVFPELTAKTNMIKKLGTYPAVYMMPTPY